MIGLSHQLIAWIDYARDFGYTTKNFKYESGILGNNLKKFLSEFQADDDLLYEHSVQISELFERIAKMDESEVKRVLGLISKIEDQRTRKST